MDTTFLPVCCPRTVIAVEVSGATASSVTVAVRGEIDMDNGEHLRHVLSAALAATPQTLIVEMSGVTFLGSVGIQLLVECRAAAEAAGRRLVLADISSWVRRVFEMAGVQDYFDLQNT